MRPGRTYLKFHFIIFGLLSVLAHQMPLLLLYMAMFTAGAGIVLIALIIASPTILLYSFALLPLWFAVTDRPRRWPQIVIVNCRRCCVRARRGLTHRRG